MDKVFVYWDNSNIYHEAQRLAEEKEGTPGARWLIRINFEMTLDLAQAGRPVHKAMAAGSIPPEMRGVWNRLESRGVEVRLFDRGAAASGEQEVPDRLLQLEMLKDALIHNGDPGTVALLTGDGAGYEQGEGFHTTLELMHAKGWKIEILSWAHSCNQRMRRWAEQNGVFVPLDDFYDSITFREPSRPGHELALGRDSSPLDLAKRQIS